eukprot:205819_1
MDYVLKIAAKELETTVTMKKFVNKLIQLCSCGDDIRATNCTTTVAQQEMKSQTNTKLRLTTLPETRPIETRSPVRMTTPISKSGMLSISSSFDKTSVRKIMNDYDTNDANIFHHVLNIPLFKLFGAKHKAYIAK